VSRIAIFSFLALIACLTAPLRAQSQFAAARLAQVPSYEEFYDQPVPETRPEDYSSGETWTGDSECPSDTWSHQLLPDGLIFDNFLASTKESRMSLQLVSSKGDSTFLDGTLGARVGIWRYGTTDAFRPEGWQLDIEGSGQVRLDLPEDRDVRSVDFRAGIPISYGVGRHRVKFGYYHLSSHVGDEYLLKNPGFNRLNYSRDVFILGYSYYMTQRLRVYGEVGWAAYSDVSLPWEFQFGFDYAPCGPTGIHGEPFYAANVQLREEVNFGGGFTFEAGWAWRGLDANMLRTGVFYYNGESNQFSFYDWFEEQLGFGMWYDF
jgi:Protein of unknown function (DUF1207)